jgi:hypothetical protein
VTVAETDDKLTLEDILKRMRQVVSSQPPGKPGQRRFRL